MCLPKAPKVPKEDPAVIAAREAKLREEQELARKAKEDQLDTRKGGLAGAGTRSLITSSSGAGYGRNFF